MGAIDEMSLRSLYDDRAPGLAATLSGLGTILLRNVGAPVDKPSTESWT
jgi:hypothetical protein